MQTLFLISMAVVVCIGAGVFLYKGRAKPGEAESDTDYWDRQY